MHKRKTSRPRIVGITGGIGSGKSTVGEMLARRGRRVIDTDRIARDLISSDSPIVREIAKVLGEDVIAANGGLDRKKVANIVFSDMEKRLALEAILHPAIIDESRRQAENSGETWVFLLIPLLYETGGEATVDRVWLCYAPEHVRIARTIERDGSSRDEVASRIKAQIPDESKLGRVDFVIRTDGLLSEVEEQVDRALSTLEEG
jgi:dephospho-CoA kinase